MFNNFSKVSKLMSRIPREATLLKSVKCYHSFLGGVVVVVVCVKAKIICLGNIRSERLENHRAKDIKNLVLTKILGRL